MMADREKEFLDQKLASIRKRRGELTDRLDASAREPSNFHLRLRMAVESEGGVAAFARKVGISETMVRKYLAKSEPSRDVLLRISDATGFSVEWIASGRGSMIAPGVGEDQAPYGAGGPAPEGFVLVPRYDVRVSAGPGAIVGDENVRDWLAFRQDFIRRELGADPANVFSFDAVGDSMEPTIKHGDTLTFVRITGALPSDGIFALGIGDALVVKRVQPVLGGLMLLSDNPAYKAETLSLEEAREVRALGRLKVISRVL